ncbi:MAG: 16S rRNA (guanine(527)-N(7))-methyltransferase RsmG [Candidatus Limivicinus sp.]
MLEALLQSGFEALSLVPDSQALSRYRIYYEYLEAMNQVMNLTAISGEEDVARLHFLDCAALLGLADFSGKKVIDVGTGAGFPGLALKIACPAMELTLLDSLDKRINFLKNTCEKLGFDDVTCIHSRAEEIPAGFRQGFDFALSRAVARLNLLCELCLPYVKKGGAFIAMKGSDLEEELAEAQRCIRTLGGQVEQKIDYTIPGTDVTHSALIIRKVADTPAKYPRRWAQIKKSPL